MPGENPIDAIFAQAAKRARSRYEPTFSAAPQPKEEDMPALEAKPGFKFGCDPELFVLNAEGVAVSPDFIPGTKDEPYKVDCGAVQRDGMAAEFNIDPVTTFDDWNKNIKTVLAGLEKFLPAGHALVPKPAVVFDAAIFDAAPDVGKELGCQPDFNAWTGEINPPPNDPENPYLRTASGHLHVGWTEDADLSDVQHILNCRDLVKQMDWFLGGWSVQKDSDPTRRRLYGRAGACRYKPYGVEYRVLSNFWVTERHHRLAVWNRMQLAIDGMAGHFMPDYAPSIYSDILQTSINESKLNRDLKASYPYPLTNVAKKGMY